MLGRDAWAPLTRVNRIRLRARTIKVNWRHMARRNAPTVSLLTIVSLLGHVVSRLYRKMIVIEGRMGREMNEIHVLAMPCAVLSQKEAQGQGDRGIGCDVRTQRERRNRLYRCVSYGRASCLGRARA